MTQPIPTGAPPDPTERRLAFDLHVYRRVRNRVRQATTAEDRAYWMNKCRVWLNFIRHHMTETEARLGLPNRAAFRRKRKRTRRYPTCYCAAYKFPHSAGSGNCNGDPLSNGPFCATCGSSHFLICTPSDEYEFRRLGFNYEYECSYCGDANAHETRDMRGPVLSRPRLIDHLPQPERD